MKRANVLRVGFGLAIVAGVLFGEPSRPATVESASAAVIGAGVATTVEVAAEAAAAESPECARAAARVRTQAARHARRL